MSTSSSQQQVSDKTQSAKQQASNVVDGVKDTARQATGRAAHSYNKRLRPMQDYIEQQLEHRPITTTFIATFAVFSFIPILSFAVFALSSIVVVGGAALAISLAILGFVVGGAALLLGGTLILTSLAAATATLWIGGAFAVFRLLVCMSQAPSVQEGVKSFLHEVKTTFVGERGGLHVDTQGDVKSVGFKVES
ncbi:hypothetical protein ACM66B_002906 [Microbotryomycetes sp. NB124-2]